MKKNLKIVSAAAAALLAVAPVVATGVSAHAQVISHFEGGTNLFPSVNDNDINVSANVSASMIGGQGNKHASNLLVNGTVTAAFGGHSYTGNLAAQKANIYERKSNGHFSMIHTADLKAGQHYFALVKGVQFALGANNTNKSNVKMAAGDNVVFAGHYSNSDIDPAHVGKVAPVSTDAVGTTSPVNMLVEFTASDVSDTRAVGFIERQTGEPVTSGDVTVRAGANKAVNLNTILSEVDAKYAGAQWNNATNHENVNLFYPSTSLSDLASQARKAGLTVDNAGYIENAPKTMHFTFNATSPVNAQTASLAVTVNVPNGTETSNPSEYDHTVRVWNKKASYIYNENHQRLANGMLYKVGSGHNVVAENGQPKVYHVGGIDAYKLADGHYKGNYVDVRNFSTSRVNSNVKIVTTRSRVFTNTGRVVGRHNYVNSGVRVKVSGTKTIKGHKMYRIATNRYIKAANVRNA